MRATPSGSKRHLHSIPVRSLHVRAESDATLSTSMRSACAGAAPCAKCQDQRTFALEGVQDAYAFVGRLLSSVPRPYCLRPHPGECVWRVWLWLWWLWLWVRLWLSWLWILLLPASLCLCGAGLLCPSGIRLLRAALLCPRMGLWPQSLLRLAWWPSLVVLALLGQTKQCSS